MFNRQTTLRGSFLMITGHFGEHLAQSIAYAREWDRAWTEEAQQQQKPAKKRSCRDRKSTRLNSSHGYISYAVFCLKKKKFYVRRQSFQSTDELRDYARND